MLHSALECFCAQHCNANEQLKLAKEHVPYQLPTEYTWVGYLLDAIKNSNPQLQAAIAAVKSDNDPTTGMCYNFEKCVAYILPSDPVSHQAAANQKHPAVTISETTADTTANISAMKYEIGSTGVHLWYHTSEEYVQLTKAQQAELHKWQNTPEGKAASNIKKSNTLHKTAKKDKDDNAKIIAVVNKAINAKIKAIKSSTHRKTTKKLI